MKQTNKKSSERDQSSRSRSIFLAKKKKNSNPTSHNSVQFDK